MVNRQLISTQITQGKVNRIMNTTITIMQVILALIFTGGGLTKLTLPYARFTKVPFQAWANDFKPEHVRLIGVLEACAAVGLVAGAMATHLRRSEYLNMVGNLVWLVLALFITYSYVVGAAV
jgi:hypothetical protein